MDEGEGVLAALGAHTQTRRQRWCLGLRHPRAAPAGVGSCHHHPLPAAMPNACCQAPAAAGQQQLLARGPTTPVPPAPGVQAPCCAGPAAVQCAGRVHGMPAPRTGSCLARIVSHITSWHWEQRQGALAQTHPSSEMPRAIGRSGPSPRPPTPATATARTRWAGCWCARSSRARGPTSGGPSYSSSLVA